MIKSKNGITLITLIITIIVLLILVTVPLSNMRDDGVVNKTQQAVQIYDQKSAESDLKMGVAQCYSLYGNLDNLGDMLDNSIWNYESGVATTKDGQHSFNVSADGDVTYKGE